MNRQRVVAVLERLARSGVATDDPGPQRQRVHSKVLDAWAHRHGMELDFSRPGKPTENAFVESFNGKLRQECLRQNWFSPFDEARTTIEAWRQDYNEYRPHSSQAHHTPSEFVAGCNRSVPIKKLDF